MTAVAEGASIFAESIDWTTQNRERKSSRGVIESKGALSLVFKFQARTPNKASKIAIKFDDYTEGYEYQVDSISTGWTSGRVALEAMSTVTVPLGIMGENLFKVFVFDPLGTTVAIKDSQISITKTSATVEAIPASHSISIEALSSLGGKSSLSYLVKSGDSLPVKGTKMFKAAETLRAGTDN
ncbi:Hsp70 family protein, partial [Vibrio sp. F13]